MNVDSRGFAVVWECVLVWYDRAHRAMDERDEVRAVLRKREWDGQATGHSRSCKTCHGVEPDHKAGCEMAKVLGEVEEEDRSHE